MGIGDIHSTIAAISASDTLTIQPGSGDEWVIHNIFTSGTIEFVVVNGSNSVIVETTDESLTAYFFHANNTQYYKIINKEGSEIKAGYDAIETK